MTGWSISREAEISTRKASTYRSIYHPGLAKPRPPLLLKVWTSYWDNPTPTRTIENYEKEIKAAVGK